MKKDALKKKILYLKYRNKIKKLNISDMLIETIIERYNINDFSNVLDIIDKSNNINDFKLNITEMLKNSSSNSLHKNLLMGNLLNRFDFVGFSFEKISSQLNLSNFNYDLNDNKEILNILRNNFYEYVISNNEMKNLFLMRDDGKYDYTIDLSNDVVLKYYDDFVLGNIYNSNNVRLIYEVICNYIVNVVGFYDKDDILNNFDFIKYDMLYGDKNTLLLDRKIKYQKEKELSECQIFEINNINKLKTSLISINNEQSMLLLKSLENIENNVYDNVEKLDEIYAQYEILFREDIIEHLYIPSKKETIITDFRDLKPQLLHVFIRDTEKFRNTLEDKILDEIISKRKNANKDKELSLEEQAEYDKRIQGVDAMLDMSLVNYSYYDENSFYSDKNGFTCYHSDTSNQLSTSLYSESYFLDNPFKSFIGVGFNSETLAPEAIVLSSNSYLTTNKGLNNLEYNKDYEFEFTKSSYNDLKNNDGKSEIVLFRKNIDFETKASYVFVSFDSQNKKSYELLEKARILSNKNNLKLVIYDLRKIHESYNQYLNNNKLDNNGVKRR